MTLARRREHLRVLVSGPRHRLVRDAQGPEDLLVEAVAAGEQLFQGSQERPRLRALDDAVVVSTGHRHDLRQTELRDDLGRHAAVFGRIVDGAGPDDRALSGHQPGDRHHRADHAGIGQGDGGLLEVAQLELVAPGPRDDVVVGQHERREVQIAGIPDVGNQQDALPAPFDVDRQTQVDGRPWNAVRDTVALDVGRVHRGMRVQRAHHGPGDEVRERHPHSRDGGLILIDQSAVLLEELDRDRAGRRCRRHAQTRRHVPCHPARGSL
jgi:hypothetical protein